ncbi:amino acid adenylation domain-containing protein [Xenorhabdus bovienii]|uniref:Amino acid adenylation domain-containing protein n=1 Tax=Xenorhabdus bovienii TaxID=40576 RepID=A0AAJ1J3P7_XENBV|nr:non-ribosomal peptide synthetase [Xenorhabdus bovienii]MDE1476885.1 amino acid adenylation domain-containing protein [Xenorhabdus bovienii]MDE1494195.1 amino acid adenylation domain-containing protein [Xenorhabdus bovienii]MDE9444925.1 amino acid adenylation domain-containing protein [Xenorhabdus bovienii]MDE9472597.1 amino acid adenylation domain-containing protein [Xenorhabdus bovienii]MDE9508636.1 amino acid adenylation domain-containing protein [Xenorhabdus bovienii]
MNLAKNSVREILKQVKAHGADLQVKGNRLFLNEGHATFPAELLEAIRENKSRIIEFFRIKNNVITRYPPLAPFSNKGNELPLSYSQERLWFLEELGLVGSAYNISDAVRIKGSLNIDALQKSFDALVRRHTVLRTRFEKRDDRQGDNKGNSTMSAMQILESPYAIDLKIIDLRHEQDKETRVHLLAKEEGARPFDLSRGRLLRAVLLKLADDEYVLLLTIHHIISDGWSMIVIIREINALYSMFAHHEPDTLSIADLSATDLPAIDFDYGDYVLWQKSWLTGDVIESELAFWRQQLEDAPDVLDIPADYPRPAVQNFEGKQHPFRLGNALSDAVNHLANEEGVTPFMVLLASFKLFLLRWTGQEDMVVGTGIAGRTHHQFEGLIGFFVNTLVMRTDMSGDPTFRTLLRRVREVAINAYAHQHLPFEKIVAELSPDRDLSRQPLVQVHIVLLNMPSVAFELPELTLTRIGSEMTTAKFDLSLFIRESEEHGFLCEFEYATALFKASTIARMAEQLTLLLQAVTANSDEKLSSFPFLTEQERQNQLQQWSGITPYLQETHCVHEVISFHAAQNPMAIAVIDGKHSYNWQTLEQRSNQLAHFLRQSGVRAETVVAICLPASFDFIVSVLAVMKAGGAYLALETRHPKNRLQNMIEEAGVEIVIADQKMASQKLQNGLYQATVCISLDEQESLISQNAVTPPQVSIHLDNLAYIIYTSGSTGKPKGVTLSHLGLSNLALHQSEAFHIDAFSRVLQFASTAFDASVSEIFTTLYRGATLCLLGEDGFQSIEQLAKLMTEQHISVVTFPPALLSQLTDYRFPDLETLVIAGEACAPEIAVEWARRCRLVNAYGPSEATVCATWADYDGSGRPPAIGSPLANVQIYLLNNALALVPTGGVGEIYIGGVGVARGYHRQPGLTAERFIPSPFVPGERLYKTGDLARFLPDGRLDFLGRNDSQLKLRGHRIELGEIQAVLLASAHVKQAHLRIWQNTGEMAQLLAYVVMDNAVADIVMDNESTRNKEYQEAVHDSVNQWARLFNETGDVLKETRQEEEDCRPSFAGWNSSYTDQPIPAAEMQHWLESTVARIRRYSPRRILEIGCGSGLVLQHLLADSDYYLGTDISVNTLAKLKKWVKQQEGFNRLALHESPADALDTLPAGQFDTVILNSVVQYFPDGDYFLTVLSQALRRLQAGGQIFIGDIQHLKLNRTFHTTVQLWKSPKEKRASEVRQAVANNIKESKELTIDHQFFTLLPAYFEQISTVEINLKCGDADNELVNYRYDVVLHTAPPVKVTPDSTLHWKASSLPEIVTLLQNKNISCVSLLHVPNLRLMKDIARAEVMHQAQVDVALSALSQEFADVVLQGEQPETYWALANQYGFDAKINWSETSDPAQFDVLFIRHYLHQQPIQLEGEHPTKQAVSRKQLLKYVNDPLRYRRHQQIIGQLREQLRERLPDYMQPAVITIMDALPLTTNGKIDNNALPVGDDISEQQAYVPVSTMTEQVVARYWCDILALKKIGAQDNFFDLGGHSLLATSMITALQGHFGIELSIKNLFEYPSVAALAAYIDTLRQNSAKSILPLLPQIRNSTLPLSYAQERLWFFEKLGLSGPAYNIPDAVELSGSLDLAALTHSFAQLFIRHEVLRTRFSECDGIAVQYIDAPWEPEIEVVDLSGQENRRSEAVKLIRQEALTPFDLSQGHLVRVKLLKLEPQRHILTITMHHIVSDGWSISILINEISQFYRAYILGFEPQMATLPVQYVDYAIWQREWLSGDVLAVQLTYWKQHLNGASPYLELPYDHPRPDVQSFRGDIVDLPVGKSLSEGLNALATRQAVTPFMLFMSAFNILLSKWGGQRDIVVGTPVAGRSHQALEGLIGFFVNTVALRTQVNGSQPFTALLRQVRETVLNVWEHQDLPFEKLVAELQPQRDLSRQPIFQCQLVFLNIPEQRLDLEGLKLTPASAGAGTAKYDLTLYVSESASGFLCQFEYAEDLFDKTTIERMAKQFEILLHDIRENSESPIDLLQLLTEQERQQLLVQFNDTAVIQGSWLPLHQRIAHLAQYREEQVAVIMGEQRYRWGELETHSNQLAHYLMTRGVGLETVVGICLDRSFEMLVAMLAVMKAGGAYLPLDPHYPRERLAHMVSDSETAIIIVRQGLHEIITNYHGVVIDVDHCRNEIASQPQYLPVVAVAPQNLAYMIYTSGSTGRPKGVMIEHHALMNFMTSMAQTLNLSENDILLAVTPISFDISILELFLPLLQQATLAIADRETATKGDALLAYLNQLHATVMQATPSTWRMLNTAGWETNKPFKILCGGEALDSGLMQQLLSRGEVWNLYGPTETTIWSTQCKLTNQDNKPWLGRPLTNTQIYILDEALSPVPLGSFGEMYIGGAGVARGYYQRPSLTAERFVPSPFTPGKRLYRTGDQVRMLAGNQLEYLGRLDNQVKLNGYRIELGEIESVLQQQPEVEQAVVMAKQWNERTDERRLVAYLRPSEREISNKNLQQQMQFSLHFFADAEKQEANEDIYSLYLSAVKQADELGFTAVWTPERHFTDIAAAFPNPATLSAALATVTKNIALRAGSVVAPLHNPLRIAEEWAVVDQLSNGRAGVAFAPGWFADDFVLAPENFADKRQRMQHSIQMVQKLWRGEAVLMSNGEGREVPVCSLPRPFQHNIPIWITAASDPKSFIDAGSQGFNVLTAMFGLTFNELAENIRQYRDAREQAGFDRHSGIITVMLHTFVADSEEEAKEIAAGPLASYFRSHVTMREKILRNSPIEVTVDQRDIDKLVEISVERFLQDSALIGSVASCLERVRKLKRFGVNEISCLIDFGIASPTILRHLHNIIALKHKLAADIDIDRLRQNIRSYLPEFMVPTEFVVMDTFPLTPNGKLDRNRLPNPEWGSAADKWVAPQNTIQARLAAIWSEVLRLKRIGINDNFFALGGDSIQSIQIVARARKAGIYFEARQLFENQTIAQLATVVTELIEEHQEIKPGLFPLLPIQQWFFEQQMVNPSHFNLSLTLKCHHPLALDNLKQAIITLINHHDALRLTFSQQQGQWQQQYGETVADFSVAFHDLSSLKTAEIESEIKDIAGQMQSSLSIAESKLMAVTLVACGVQQPQRLLMVIHHLLVDGVSWRVLIEDLQTLCQQIENGTIPALPRHHFSLQGWGEKLQRYAHDNQADKELKFWQQWVAEAHEVRLLPIDQQRDVNLARDSIMLTRRLSEEMTEKFIRDLPRVFNTQINDALLTALLRTFTRWTGDNQLLLHMEGHGRENLFPQTQIDISRTVGWFTSLFPVLLCNDFPQDDSLQNSDNSLMLLRSVKEQLRKIPSRGLGYGVLRYLGQDEKLQTMTTPEISFNYLGNLDAGQSDNEMFSLSEQSMGALRDPQQQREHLIDISGAIINGCLEIYWNYNQTIHHSQTIARLADDYMQELQTLVKHSHAQEVRYTPSDFPLMTWDQVDLDTAFSHFTNHSAVEDAYPLSPMQQGILFHSLYAEEPGAYYVTLRCTLNGKMNQTLFQQAWREVIQRHPALRTAIIAGERPLQVVLREAELDFHFIDWHTFPEEEQRVRLGELALEDRKQTVNFTHPSLMRIWLVKLAEGRYHLIWGSHLIILDGWSVPIVLGDVMNCYQSLTENMPVRLEKAGTYREYIAWLNQQDNREAEIWWREQLKGFVTPTQLGRHLHHRGNQVSGQICQEHHQHFRIGIDKLEQFCQQHRITLNTLVQGVWAELLCRYTGRRDVLFGITVSGRPVEIPAIENIAGLFISTLPFRAHFATTTSLSEWLLALQTTQTQLFDYQYSSLVDIHRWSEIPDSSPLFESVLVYENYPTDKVTSASTQNTLILSDIDNIERNNFPLTLVFNGGTSLSLKWVYDLRHFDHAGIVRLADRFEHLLTQIIGIPEGTLASLSLLDNQMYRQLTLQFSRNVDSKATDEPLLPVHRAFEHCALKYPEQIATTFSNTTYTYQQLNNEANQLAHYLCSVGIAHGSRIGILMENSSDMIVTLLGVLKAGASYVPLDQYHPQERIAYVVNDADIVLIITDSSTHHHQQIVSQLAVIPYFCLKNEKIKLSAFPCDDLHEVTPDSHDEAYVIYTSGTTGRPKGVRIGYGSLSNYVAHAAANYLSSEKTDRPFASYVFLPLTFDASVTAIYAPLVVGKTIFISESDSKQPLTDIQRAEGGVEFVKLTPAHLRLLQARDVTLNFTDKLVVGGEALSASDLRHCGDIEVINEYGPTEATVGSTIFSTHASKAEARVPIGRPIRNVTHYVLNHSVLSNGNEEMTLAPIGMVGELYIGGMGVALGYVNNPLLTAQHFVTTPFSGEERLYRTGDNVCWREDGTLEYLGRLDRQIKLRGYRIEVQEIEAIISAVQGVNEAAVVLRNPESEQAQLAAYVVMEKQEPDVLGEYMNHHLAQSLPVELIPTVWCFLSALPVTRNGKIDYAALTAMQPEEENHIEPETILESEVVEIWAKTLEQQQISRNARFFNLGGNSLNATRIVAAIQKKYGVEMSVRVLLENPSLRQFSVQLETLLSNTDRSALPDRSEDMVGVVGII